MLRICVFMYASAYLCEPFRIAWTAESSCLYILGLFSKSCLVNHGLAFPSIFPSVRTSFRPQLYLCNQWMEFHETYSEYIYIL